MLGAKISARPASVTKRAPEAGQFMPPGHVAIALDKRAWRIRVRQRSLGMILAERWRLTFERDRYFSAIGADVSARNSFAWLSCVGAELAEVVDDALFVAILPRSENILD
jgi:hypothetical protein